MGPCPSVVVWSSSVRNLADPCFGMPFVQILRQFPVKHVPITSAWGVPLLEIRDNGSQVVLRIKMCSKECFVAICRHLHKGGSLSFVGGHGRAKNTRQHKGGSLKSTTCS